MCRPADSLGSAARHVVAVLSVASVLCLVSAAPAAAYWRSSGHGAGTVTTAPFYAPTGVIVPSNSLSSVHVSWTAPTDPTTPTGYYVQRTSGGTTTAACGSNPTTIAGTSCDDGAVPDGTYTYAVTAVFRSWALTSAPSGPVAVATPTKVAFTVQPSNTVAGAAITPSVVVALQTVSGSAVPLAGRSVALAIGTSPGGGTLSGTVSGSTNSSGVVTFAGLSINKSGVGYTLTATSSGLTSATSGTFNVTAATASRFVITSGAVSGTASSSPALGPITVAIQDAFGNAVAPTGATAVTLVSNSAGTARFAATFAGATTTTVTIPANSSSTTFYYGDTMAGAPTITVSGAYASGTQAATINAGAPAKFAITSAALSNGAASISATLGPLTIQRQDALGNPVTPATSETVTLASNSAGTARFSATLGGTTTTTVTIPANSSSVNFYYGDTMPGSSTITTSGALASATQVETIVVGAAYKLVITSGSIAGVASEHASRGPITVQVQDIADNPVTTGVVVSLSSDTAGTAIFSPTLDATTNASTLTIPSGSSSGSFYYGDTKAGTSTITAAVSGLVSANRTGVITPAVASQLVFGQQPTNTQKSHVITPAVTARILDRFGNLTTSTASVSIVIGVNGGNILLGLGAGNLNGTQTVAGVAGVATFSTLQIDGGLLNAGGEGTGYTLKATSSGLTTATSAAFNIT